MPTASEQRLHGSESLFEMIVQPIDKMWFVKHQGASRREELLHQALPSTVTDDRYRVRRDPEYQVPRLARYPTTAHQRTRAIAVRADPELSTVWRPSQIQYLFYCVPQRVRLPPISERRIRSVASTGRRPCLTRLLDGGYILHSERPRTWQCLAR